MFAISAPKRLALPATPPAGNSNPAACYTRIPSRSLAICIKVLGYGTFCGFVASKQYQATATQQL